MSTDKHNGRPVHPQFVRRDGVLIHQIRDTDVPVFSMCSFRDCDQAVVLYNATTGEWSHRVPADLEQPIRVTLLDIEYAQAQERAHSARFRPGGKTLQADGQSMTLETHKQHAEQFPLYSTCAVCEQPIAFPSQGIWRHSGLLALPEAVRLGLGFAQAPVLSAQSVSKGRQQLAYAEKAVQLALREARAARRALLDAKRQHLRVSIGEAEAEGLVSTCRELLGEELDGTVRASDLIGALEFAWRLGAIYGETRPRVSGQLSGARQARNEAVLRHASELDAMVEELSRRAARIRDTVRELQYEPTTVGAEDVDSPGAGA